jgi:hypothetical protein
MKKGAGKTGAFFMVRCFIRPISPANFPSDSAACQAANKKEESEQGVNIFFTCPLWTRRIGHDSLASDSGERR